MLTEKEEKELSKLSEPLRQKVLEWSSLFDRVKKSHSLDTYLTILKQKQAWQNEIDETPFTVRGLQEANENNPDEKKDISEVIKEAMTSRQNTETAMKIIKLLPELDEDLERIYGKLTADEKNVAREKAGAAENLLEVHLKRRNG